MDEIEVLILCGGLGTRLSAISNGTPKGLMKGPSGDPFIWELINQIQKYGLKKITLALGYGSQEYINYFQSELNRDVAVRFSIETTPLGTGGAVINALNEINGKTFFVVNGDTQTSINYCEMLKFHRQKYAQLTIAGLEILESRADVGGIKYDLKTNAVLEFNEKNSSLNCVNAGIYIFEKEVISSKAYRVENLSLEKQIIPDLIASNMKTYLYKFSGEMRDIGTPERYHNYVQEK